MCVLEGEESGKERVDVMAQGRGLPYLLKETFLFTVRFQVGDACVAV